MAYDKFCDPVAQLVEQCPFKALAEGSNPSWVTFIFMKVLYFIILINFMSAYEVLNDEASKVNPKNKLIFIYNASDDYLSVAFDFTHKIISPKTYQCSLCKVTYGAFTMHKEWKEYIELMNFDVMFLYKNNYQEYYPTLEVKTFPSAFIYDGEFFSDFLDKKDFDLCLDLESLMKLIDSKLEKNYENIQKY